MTNTPPAVSMPTDAAKRKAIPLVAGVLDYFPAALAAVAELSRVGNEQHNPGQPMHHNRSKSTDHAECILRHLIDRGTVDIDGIRHSVKVAWRALAMLQVELEHEAGAPLPRGAKVEPTRHCCGRTAELCEASPAPACAGTVMRTIFKDQVHPGANDGHQDGAGMP